MLGFQLFLEIFLCFEFSTRVPKNGPKNGPKFKKRRKYFHKGVFQGIWSWGNTKSSSTTQVVNVTIHDLHHLNRLMLP